MVGEVGIEPTQREAKDLQSSPALQLRRSPKYPINQMFSEKPRQPDSKH